MKKIVFMLVFLMTAATNRGAFAQQEQRVDVKAEDLPGKTFTANPGEHLTIVVHHKKKAPPEVAPIPVTNVTKKYVIEVHKGVDLHMRGGVSIRTFQGKLATSAAQLVGVVGQMGFYNDHLRLQGRFDVGKCRYDNVAIGGSLALMTSVSTRWWLGIGADLLYCSDTNAHPKEQAAQRFVGGSARVAYEIGHFVFGGYVGISELTEPIPGGRTNKSVGVGGFSLSYLF